MYHKNDIPIKLADFPYVLVNKIILCNCKLEGGESFLLDSLAAWSDNPDQFKMYFILTLAFVNYFDNWMDSYMATIDLNITEKKQMLPLALLNLSPNDSVLINRSYYVLVIL